MRLGLWPFNAFLLAALAGWGAGCQGPGAGGKFGAIRLHLETAPDGTERSGVVAIGQPALFAVNVEKRPFLDERSLKEVVLVEAPDGLALKLQFDQRGTWLLEQYSASQPGKRVAVFAQWDKTARWLAAPRLEKRLTNGVLVFTPQTSREEAEQLVQGLNKAARVLGGGQR